MTKGNDRVILPHMVEASVVQMTPEELLRYQRRERAYKKGKELVRDFDGNTDTLEAVIKEVAGIEDSAVRSGLVRGVAEGVAFALFPDSGTTHAPVDAARIQFRTGATIAMNRAIGAIRNSTDYPRLEIGRFLLPRQ